MKTVVISQLGTVLDNGFNDKRWQRWRPNVSMCMQETLSIDELHLLYPPEAEKLLNRVTKDIAEVSPQTQVITYPMALSNPWDLEEVYSALHDFCYNFEFNLLEADYLFHLTTGTHIGQISIFLLNETGYFPGRLLQTAPKQRKKEGSATGVYEIIDLNLAKYDAIARRFDEEMADDISFLKSGIATANVQFNQMIDEIEKVAIRSTDPILLTGPTGAGKSSLARRIYELRKQKHQLQGNFIEVNCATLRGDAAMSTLFGHKKGAFTGAVNDRPGLLKAAHNGMIFLDEIGELGLDEQAMLLRAIEDKRFTPLGSDQETSSDFTLICGTNRDLRASAQNGDFREDLLARINLWTWCLPGLKERIEDLEPNLDFELSRISRKLGKNITINAEARKRFLHFATSITASWRANFRDLNAAITRMGTLAEAGRIDEANVTSEIQRLQHQWETPNQNTCNFKSLQDLLGKEAETIDLFDQAQLNTVIEICQQSSSLAEAGRRLFAQSRQTRKTVNDSDRLKKYLAKFGLSWQEIKAN